MLYNVLPSMDIPIRLFYRRKDEILHRNEVFQFLPSSGLVPTIPINLDCNLFLGAIRMDILHEMVTFPFPGLIWDALKDAEPYRTPARLMLDSTRKSLTYTRFHILSVGDKVLSTVSETTRRYINAWSAWHTIVVTPWSPRQPVCFLQGVMSGSPSAMWSHVAGPV